MATYKVRVEDLVGSVGDDAALSDWLTSGAKYLADIASKEKLLNYSTSSNITTASGVSIQGKKLLSATRDGFECIEFPPGQLTNVQDSLSILYATRRTPVIINTNGTVKTYPAGSGATATAALDGGIVGTVTVTAGGTNYIAPAVAFSGGGGTGAAATATVVKGVITAVTMGNQGTGYSSAPTVSFTDTNNGVARVFSYPSIAYGDSTIADYPLELEQGIVLYASIQGRIRQLSDLAITTINGLSFTEQAVLVPPEAPSFTYTDVTVGTIASTTVTFSDTLAYTPPVFGGAFTNTDTALSNQDIELANAHLNKVNSQLELMQKDLLNSLNEFNRDKGEYDGALQKAITDAQLTQQRLTRAAELATDANKQDEALTLQKQVQEYESKLQLFGQQVNDYSQRVQQEVSRISARLNQYNGQAQIMLQGLQALRNEFNEFIKAI